MKRKTTTIILVAILVSLLLASNVLAITGKLLPAKRTLRGLPGEPIERSIEIINDNNVRVTITLTPDGELAEKIDLEESEFDLAPGQSKKVDFTITPDRVGTTHSSINVLFVSEEGDGVGVIATITVIASGGDVSTTDSEDTEDSLDSDLEFEELDSENTVGFGTEGRAPKEQPISEKLKSNSPVVLSISTIALVMVFVILLFFYLNKKTKKKVGRADA